MISAAMIKANPEEAESYIEQLLAENEKLRAATQTAQKGCVCPPTSNRTCQNPTCPRKNPFRQTA